MPSSHLILCRPLLLLPPIPPTIRVFSNESTLRMRWPKYWSFSFSIIPSKKSQGWSPSEWTGWISLQSKGLSGVLSNTTVEKHQFYYLKIPKWAILILCLGSSFFLPLKFPSFKFSDSNCRFLLISLNSSSLSSSQIIISRVGIFLRHLGTHHAVGSQHTCANLLLFYC